MQSLLEKIGGQPLVNRSVAEFYQAIGKHLSDGDSADHQKQCNRQSQFLIHALSSHPEPIHSGRANFLAQGLDPVLFEALLEYFEGRLLELGFPAKLSAKLVHMASDLYDDSDVPLAIAC